MTKIQNQKIIALSSKIAGGKGTVAYYLNKKYNYPILRFSEMLRDILKRLYLKETRSNIQKIGTVLRKNFGQDIMSWVMLNEIKENKAKVIIIDAVRRQEDLKLIKKENYNLYLIYIETDIKNRFKRLQKRNDNIDDQQKSWKKFLQEDRYESETTIKNLKQQADFVIQNNETKKELYQKIEKIIKKINKP